MSHRHFGWQHGTTKRMRVGAAVAAIRARQEHDMPFKSKAQAAAMHAAAEGHGNLGIPRKVAKKFVAEGHGQKLGNLPEHKGSPFKLKRRKQ
jgi:hypothetical protein